MDIPPALSGCFGDLRTGHFHSGIDFRTQGAIGKNVFAVEDGFVSRIRIQTGGYGKALYIDHPNGYTSVYGHLEDFNESIDKYVKDMQYSRQSHSIELFPEPDKLKVKKGELIAFSGNTGSSAGPHLHFELRETKDQIPINVLLYNNMDITDTAPPVMYSLSVYPTDSFSQVNKNSRAMYFPLEKISNGNYRIQNNSSIKISGKAGLGIEAFDFLNDGSLRCGVYSLELIANGKTIYKFEADKFRFDETRFLNAHIDYAMMKLQKKKINLLYRKPNNRVSLHKNLINDGILAFQEGERKEIKIIAKDAAGNMSELNFVAEGTGGNNNVPGQKIDFGEIFSWKTANRFKNKDIDFYIPAGALYENIFFKYSFSENKNQFYPLLHAIHDTLVPLHKSATLRINGEMVPEKLRDKVVITRVSGGEKNESIGGRWESGWITAGTNVFGQYLLEADTLSPIIKPINISKGKNMSDLPLISFSVDDNLTGISEYNAYINKQWVLLEYDPKNKLLFYKFDPKRMQSTPEHELEIFIVDGVGNRTFYHTNFIWREKIQAASGF